MSRQKGKPAWEQPRWVVFAILALLVLVSTAASAQTTKTNETTDETWTVKNPCNTDDVVVNGKHHVVASQTMQKNGRIHLQMTDSRHGTGLGAPSGKKYSYGDTSKTNVIVPAPPDGQPTGIHRFRMKVVSEGSTAVGDNFFMTVVTMIHRNGSTSGSQDRVECRGQGKESF